ncbi:MAG: hypothetical protein ACI4L2_07750 [Wujia sp.]
MKLRKKLYVFLVFAVLSGCFFCSEKSVQAAQQQKGTNAPEMTASFTLHPNESVPEEAVKPITKGKNYIATIVTFVGWAFIVFGLIFFGLSWMSHQTDQRVIGIVSAIVGGLVAVAPKVAEWLIS